MTQSLQQLRESRQRRSQLQQNSAGREDSGDLDNLDNSLNEYLDMEGARFLPRIGLMCMLSITVWYTITYGISFFKNPEKYTNVIPILCVDSLQDIEQSGVIFAGGIMGTLFTLGLIGSCGKYKDEPSMMIPGVIGAGVTMVVAGHSLITVVVATIRQGGVYDVAANVGGENNNDARRCSTYPRYYATNRHYCNVQTVVHVLTSILIFLLSAILLNSIYGLWKYLIAKNKTTNKQWTLDNNEMIENDENRIYNRSRQQPRFTEQQLPLINNYYHQQISLAQPEISFPGTMPPPSSNDNASAPMPPPRYIDYYSSYDDKSKFADGSHPSSY